MTTHEKINEARRLLVEASNGLPATEEQHELDNLIDNLQRLSRRLETVYSKN